MSVGVLLKNWILPGCDTPLTHTLRQMAWQQGLLPRCQLKKKSAAKPKHTEHNPKKPDLPVAHLQQGRKHAAPAGR
jgi:hypothetical protein